MKKIILIFSILSSFQVTAQSISSSLISSDGGSFYQIYAKIDWAIGETITDTYKSNNNYLTQGFIQGATTSLNEIPEHQFLGIKMHLFPNPFTKEFEVNFTGLSNYQKPSIQIFDILGKEVFFDNNMGNENKINLEQLCAGVYIVKVIIDNQGFGSYRIEKLD